MLDILTINGLSFTKAFNQALDMEWNNFDDLMLRVKEAILSQTLKITGT